MTGAWATDPDPRRSGRVIGTFVVLLCLFSAAVWRRSPTVGPATGATHARKRPTARTDNLDFSTTMDAAS